jgi:hypothetical protein
MCRTVNRNLIPISVLLSLLAGCPEEGTTPPPGELKIGVLEADGSFRALNDGDSMAVLLGANGLNMVVPSVRAVGVNPRKPDPDVEVEVAGHIMAAILEAERVDMEADGDGYVLENLQVPFQAELCCYVCTEGTIFASLRDSSGRVYEGQVTVRMERGGCPDVDACCSDASACVDPSLTQVCM